MKKSFLLLLLFGLFFWRVLESSADSPDENRQGTLTVTLFYEEEKTAVEGAGLEFIEVADLKFSEGQVSYSLLPDFAESSLKLEGMKAGYTEASGEYEQKLRKQAEAFLNQTKDFEKEKEEYNKLLDKYEAHIIELEQKGVNNNLIEEEKEVYGKLKKLKCY